MTRKSLLHQSAASAALLLEKTDKPQRESTSKED
jgi:hypothetical protein